MAPQEETNVLLREIRDLLQETRARDNASEAENEKFMTWHRQQAEALRRGSVRRDSLIAVLNAALFLAVLYLAIR
jgi:hypothetical protein